LLKIEDTSIIIVDAVPYSGPRSTCSCRGWGAELANEWKKFFFWKLKKFRPL